MGITWDLTLKGQDIKTPNLIKYIGP